MAIAIKRLPAGFVFPAQPVLRSKPPSGADWVHEIKHDGYRMIVRRDGPTVRLYGRNAYDWTARLAAIATAAQRINKAKSFTIDGEAVVLGADGLSLFEDLSRRKAAQTATLYAFDLIEHDGEDLRGRPFLDPRQRWRDSCVVSKLVSCLMSSSLRMGRPCSPACQLGAEGIVSKKVDDTYRSGMSRVWIRVRNPASIAVQRERSEISNRRASGAPGKR